MASVDAVVARNVRAERVRKGWRQADLGAAVGWSTFVVSDVETGKRRLSLGDVVLLCRALGVPLSKLLEGIEPADLGALGI